MKKIEVCTVCGSADVLLDAFVHANNPDDVRTFDDRYCESCEGSCKTKTVEVSDDFDVYSDYFHEEASDAIHLCD